MRHVTVRHVTVRPIFDRKKRVFEPLSHAQQPLALWIACSDSRVDATLAESALAGQAVSPAKDAKHHAGLQRCFRCGGGNLSVLCEQPAECTGQRPLPRQQRAGHCNASRPAGSYQRARVQSDTIRSFPRRIALLYQTLQDRSLQRTSRTSLLRGTYSRSADHLSSLANCSWIVSAFRSQCSTQKFGAPSLTSSSE